MKVERFDGIYRFLAAASTRSRRGITRRTGQLIAQAIRFGPGSLSEQFARQSGASVLRGNMSWPPTQPFGTLMPGSRTLHRSGRLLGAWQGRDAASKTEITPHSVAVGVRGGEGRLEQSASVFQRSTPTRIQAKTRTPSGRLSMQIQIGRKYGVWRTEEALLRGFLVPPRPVGISREVVNRVGAIALRHVVGVEEVAG